MRVVFVDTHSFSSAGSSHTFPNPCPVSESESHLQHSALLHTWYSAPVVIKMMMREGLNFTVSRGYPTATPKAPEHTDQNTVTCNITEKLWILSCFRRLELLVKQSHIHIRTSDRTGDEIREVASHDQNQQNRSQRNRIRSEPTDESEPAEPIHRGTDQQMNQNQQNRSQRNRNRSEPTDESEQAEPITEEPNRTNRNYPNQSNRLIKTD